MVMQMTTYGITRNLRPLKSFFAPNQISSSPPHPYYAPMQSQLFFSFLCMVCLEGRGVFGMEAFVPLLKLIYCGPK